MVVFRHEDAGANIAHATGLLGWNRQPYSGKRVCGSKSSSFEDEGSWVSSVVAAFADSGLSSSVDLWIRDLPERRKTIAQGHERKAWTEQELEPLRLRLSHPVGKWLIGIVVVIAAFGILILLSARGFSSVGLIWVLLFPLQIMARVYQTVMPVGRSDSMQLGNNFAPIQSEHWGGRR